MKRMKALGVVEWHLTRRQAIYYLLSIGMPTAFYLFFSGMYQETPGAPAHFMRDYLLSMTAFSMMSTAIFSFPTVLETDRLNNWQKVLRHTPVSMVEYYLIKVVGLFVDFLLSIGVVFTGGPCGAACEYVLAGLGLSSLPSHLRKSSFCSYRSGLDLASFQSIDVCCGQSPLHGAWLSWVVFGCPFSLFPEWMQAIGKCLPTYQLMELIKTFLNKGQVNVFASVYLTLFTLVLFALVIIYRRHSEVRS